MDTPPSTTYDYVMSRERVIILLLIAALIGLDVNVLTRRMPTSALIPMSVYTSMMKRDLEKIGVS